MTDKDLLHFLLNSSRTDLQEAMLKRLNVESESRKDALEALARWVEQAAESKLVAWFTEHGDELAARLIEKPGWVEEVKPLPENPFRLPRRANLKRELHNWRKRA